LRMAIKPKFSGAKAGRAIGVDANTVYRYERGEERVSKPRLAQFAELYGVDVVWLSYGPQNSSVNGGLPRENDSVSRFLASPMAGVVPEDMANRLRCVPYWLFGYDEPDESDVASVCASLELHLARAFKKSCAGSQPPQVEPSEPPPPVPEPPSTVPKRGRKRTRRSE
jgi:transcriptional regulator with XRE-family HTH domain